MKLKLITIGVLILCFSCNAQQKRVDKKCYKTSWTKRIENKLPESICIKEDEMIYTLFNKFDFDGDGLQDVAIKTGKKNRKNGDIRKLSIYKKINDSIFAKVRELDNVYPLWFANYNPLVELEDPKLNALKQQYEMGNPLQEIELIDNKIVLNLYADVGYKYILTFVYSNEKKDWFLIKYDEYDSYNDIKKPHQNNRIGTSISEFSFVEFLNGEY